MKNTLLAPESWCLAGLILMMCCASGSASDEPAGRFDPNDARFAQISANTAGLLEIVSIDHARLALDAGVNTMPPSRVLIFNNPEVSTRLIQAQPMLGLDLPYRVLAYEDQDGAGIAYLDESFLRARHGLDNSVDLVAYMADLQQALQGFGQEVLKPVMGDALPADFGILTITSDFDFATTVEKTRAAIMSQGDTVWFATVDYQGDAARFGVTIPASSLLLFGGPAPGGMAMSQYPRLGLDAFCQKILVLESPAGVVSLHFNDIVALANMHYGSNNKPQAVINQRLMDTLGEAVAGTP